MRVNIAVEERKELSNTIYINRTRVKPKPVYDFFKRLFDILTWDASTAHTTCIFMATDAASIRHGIRSASTTARTR